jgi:protease I
MRIAVLLEDNYQVLEAWYPYLFLKGQGIETVFVGPAKREYKSKEGYPAAADLAVADLDIGDIDGVVIPGGYAPDLLRRYKEVTDLVKKVDDEGKLVAAICHAGWVLVSAGILKGRKATGFYAIKDDIKNAGARYEDKEVIVDGNLITSRNPYDLPAFCGAILKFLQRSPHSKG